jgi:hypothetical protein
MSIRETQRYIEFHKNDNRKKVAIVFINICAMVIVWTTVALAVVLLGAI